MTPPPMLRFCRSLVFLFFCSSMMTQSGHAGVDLENRKGKMANKLDSFVLKKIDFDETPIKNAVEFLVAQSRELDPSGDGVNILLKSGAEKLKDSSQAATISLSLRNVTLRKAIKYLAEVANLRYKIDADGVVIGTEADFSAGRTETRVFHMAPGAFPSEIQRDSGEAQSGFKQGR